MSGLLTALLFVLGCAAAGRDEHMSQAPPPSPSGAAALAPISGHPPVTTSGVVASIDPATGIITFQDGRIMKLTEQSTVLQPVEARAVRPGEPVIVRNALPVGVKTTNVAPDKRQRMATIASIDEPSQMVRLTDGTAVRVTPSTKMQMGTAGAPLVLAELRPGDELVIVIAEGSPATAGQEASPAPSALPREAATSPAPSEASQVMVFRQPQAP
jgi:hypothetical protein